MKKLSTTDIISKKNREKIVMITAYDALFARLFDEFADMILIGDSLNMSFKGERDTISATIEDMIYHTKAVKNGAKNSFIVTDMPFGSTTNIKHTIKNAIKIYKETSCDAVKIEGGKNIAPHIKALCNEGISVVGHIGLMPQKVRFEGGYRIKGRGEDGLNKLLDDAFAIYEAGAFCFVLEGTLSSVAAEISKQVPVPVIGIGSGLHVDGQVLVWSDMLGLFEDFRPKFVKQYLNGATLVKEAVKSYKDEVKNSLFPSENFEYNK
ncbi:3-methyl-2-oxobutanoate hydroxymethyltransferase [Campylobacter sp. RM12327]|uniref:3-methyl-2-oxobutanoate hydroxymethyltransferase n=1 Tax=Campylobacter sputorum TaxID=206 RepID=UPI000B7739D0|nr:MULTISPECIES: 3-methyl-2-oxobutanoate hydroxymethyltransferase [Campylobacter]ASM39926.1 3-methyl-2-oxobutanoate hydroxymethyltransferase [Campylobacter sputorum]MBE7357577.1 3-methyl-2-oxobutanoate hydroxymethyltransferase [Campylobacter sp. RM11302]MBF6669223.1 3-methyl-2-oxobutanoate hydroxymethyltransferase [Campylobacter sp. RM12327]MBF6674492.1 3-methyl-2-oxobutanoate hydroxymethyltransferase [Campylobacter sp. RM13538]MBF6675445.1 3-methyl-2-oxobutanoate hydroxymethyltransferase [Cam